MQRVTLVRYAAKPERADENEALSRKVFAELRRVRPHGVAYALFRSGDEFVHLFVNFEDDSSDAVTELPSFKAFSAASGERMVEPPQPLRIATDLVESYGFEGAEARV
ncbi:hypothetical protein ACO2Q3_06765 [Caulobacter sp. KR2-114]|uniref:hypothetical protein n=1 Tax=Caulobacter sp. KR2-114 TaxID=3400912 RepID=UPI003BFAE322